MKVTHLMRFFLLLLSVSSIDARINFTTIDTPGFYQLGDDLTNSVTITVSNVTFDMNGHTITATNGIVINSSLDSVCVKNGIIESTLDGVVVNAGCTNITMENMRVRDGVRGINFDQVTGGLITNCDMSSNSTGIEIATSQNIVVKDCVASNNLSAGYSLLSSTTNLFENCKSLSTGKGNTEILNNDVFGFVSSGGYGNIFERCIANATQALSTTDANSIVAGFALKSGEQCTKIIHSEASNSCVSADGVTIPFGIFLEGTVDTLTAFTVYEIDVYGGAVNWSPDGRYLAAGSESGGSIEELQIFEYDRNSEGLERIAQASLGGNVLDLKWSPSGQFLAVGVSSGATNNFLIYEFDPNLKQLTQIVALDVGGAVSIAWSSDQLYLAVGAGVPRLRIYSFNPVLKEVALVSSDAPTNSVTTLDWRNDGKYLAVGLSSPVAGELRLYSFERVPNVLTLEQSIDPDATVQEVQWSPNNLYLGVSIDFNTGNELRVYQFDDEAVSLSELGGVALTGGFRSFDWSSDGRFIAAATSTLNNDLRIFKFDPDATSFEQLGEYDTGSVFIRGVSLSPDSSRIAIAHGNVGGSYRIINGLSFPEKNIVTSNTVYCNSGSAFNGVGIAGSSIQNMIIGNMSYNNPLNYAYVPNVFNRLFGQLPSELQNVSLVGCDPISSTEDIVLLIKQIFYNVTTPIPSQLDLIEESLIENIIKTCAIESQQDVIESKIDAIMIESNGSQLDIIEASVNETLSKTCAIESQQDEIESKLDVLDFLPTITACSPAAIFQPTIITESGSYCVADNIAGQIQILANDVTLDLNGRSIVNSSGVGVLVGTIGSMDNDLHRIAIRNGFVGSATDACLAVLAGCTDISIDNVNADDCGTTAVVLSGNASAPVERATLTNSRFSGANQSVIVEFAKDIKIEKCVASNSSDEAGIRIADASQIFLNSCDMVLNTTGVVIRRCYDVVLDSCNALSNYSAGFSLETTFTTCLRNCKAINTGETNDIIVNNNVYGFVSDGGYGNIFERCIANATQAFSTTDADSIVAGFALINGERCTKIIESEASNSVVSSSGVTIPYGIFLESTVDSLAAFTVYELDVYGGAVDWHPDGRYLAAGSESGGSIEELQIFEYNRNTEGLERIAQVGLGGDVLDIKWSPSGQFLAVGVSSGAANNFLIYEFDPNLKQLTQIVALDVDGAISIAWSSDQLYLAVGAGAPRLRIYSFNPVLKEVALVSTDSPTNSVTTLDWRDDGKHLAVGLTSPVAGELRLYSFERVPGVLTLEQSIDPDATVQGVQWSPNNLYLGVSIDLNTGNELRVYQFDDGAVSLTELGGVALTGGFRTFDWSSDGRFIAAATSTLNNDLRIFKFDPDATNFEQLDEYDTGSVFIRGVSWSPDSTRIAIAHGNTGGSYRIINGISFPEKNVVKDNVVYCNSGNSSNGIGISGSSIDNMIVGNTSYNNPLNFAYVPNVFNSLFGQTPSDVQNISLNGCDPISSPEDIVLIAKQTLYKVCTPIPSQLDVIESKLDLLSTTSTCSFSTLSEPTIISQPGNYCLAQNISGQIQVTSNDVTLDLNGRTVSNTNGAAVLVGTIGSMDNDLHRITIQNGFVGSSSGSALQVLAGCTDIDINSVNSDSAVTSAIQLAGTAAAPVERATVRNGRYSGAGQSILVEFGKDINIRNCVASNGDGDAGICLADTSQALLDSCDMILNSTGLEIQRCFDVVVDSCKAISNFSTGFSLEATSTSCVKNCKAINTGEPNDTILNNNVYGFVSDSGYGNIFENCIANATQALSTTDAGSIVAGFGLLGTESCSKIIGCEAGNSRSSADGVTIPYGIFLEGGLDSLITVTQAFDTGTSPREALWSSDGKYLAADEFKYDTGSDRVGVFEFDRNSSLLTLQAAATSDALLVNWHPNDRYVLYTNGTNLELYEFDRRALTFKRVVNFDTGSTIAGYPGSWSPDGTRVAVGVSGGTTMLIFAFDPVTMEFSLADSVTTASTSRINNIAWSHDGTRIAVGGRSATLNLELFEWDQSLNVATSLDTITGTVGFLFGSNAVGSIDWSYDDKYLAVIDLSQDGSSNTDYLNIVRVDSTSLTRVAFVTGTNFASQSVAWSLDGKYAVIGLSEILGGSNNVLLFEFERGSNQLDLISTFVSADIRYNIASSPDGAFFSWTLSFPDLGAFRIVKGLTFPEKNIISDNTVYCNSGNNCPGGVGILGSSISNQITKNTSYNNPTNYLGAVNVFNQLFGQAPSDIQNISLVGCDPISTPDDIALLARQTLYKVCTPIPSQLDVIESKLDMMGGCSSDVITTPITITSSGNYCLGSDITGNITINSSNVTLDLNGRNLVGEVSITGTSVEVLNGTVSPPQPTSAPNAAVTINDGSWLITIQDVNIECVESQDGTSGGILGRTGISSEGSNIVIRNCTILAGDGGAGTSSGLAGGDGISASGYFYTIDSCSLQSGIGGGGGTSGGSGGDGISLSNSAHNRIVNCMIMTGSGGIATELTSGGDGLSLTSVADSIVSNCTIRTGAGTGVLGAAGMGSGGDGVSASSCDRLSVEKCTISTGRGPDGDEGGRGGNGVNVSFSNDIQVTDCNVVLTGDGGNGSSAGGNGGVGIFVAGDCARCRVLRTTIANTGNEGAGGSAIAGKAIDDDVSLIDDLSMIFSNFAHNIANSIKFDLQNDSAESGVLTPNPPTSTVINPLANVYAS